MLRSKDVTRSQAKGRERISSGTGKSPAAYRGRRFRNPPKSPTASRAWGKSPRIAARRRRRSFSHPTATRRPPARTSEANPYGSGTGGVQEASPAPQCPPAKSFFPFDISRPLGSNHIFAYSDDRIARRMPFGQAQVRREASQAEPEAPCAEPPRPLNRQERRQGRSHRD